MDDQFHLTAKDKSGSVLAEGDSPEFHFKLSKVPVLVRVAESPTEPPDVVIQFKDPAGRPRDCDCLLEYADGRVEAGHVDHGKLTVPSKDAKGLKVHFPELTDAKLTDDNVEEGKDAEVVFKHSGFKEGSEATIGFFHADGDEDEPAASAHPIDEIKASLAGDQKAMVQPQEVRAKWPLKGIDKLAHGQVFTVLCKVSVGGLSIEAGHLHVHGPMEDEEG
jgi:hypothetical protein